MIKNLGFSCGHIGKMGDDEYADIIERELTADQLDRTFCRRVAGERCSLAWVMVNPNSGERCHIMHPMSEKGMFTMEEIEQAGDYLRAARAVHMEMLQMPMAPLYRVAEICSESGVVTSMDIDIAPRFLYEYRYSDPVLLRKTLGKVDVIKLCKDAVTDLTDETDMEKAAEAILAEYGMRVLIITIGEKGCVAAWKQDGDIRSVTVAGFELPGIQDTTGAGDAFQGGFLYGYLNGYSVEKAAQLGNACGYLKSRNIGARNMPDRETVESFLKTHGWESL
jgi:sugar/nucleoside kinase (ribokinase family)